MNPESFLSNFRGSCHLLVAHFVLQSDCDGLGDVVGGGTYEDFEVAGFGLPVHGLFVEEAEGVRAELYGDCLCLSRFEIDLVKSLELFLRHFDRSLAVVDIDLYDFRSGNMSHVCYRDLDGDLSAADIL